MYLIPGLSETRGGRCTSSLALVRQEVVDVPHPWISETRGGRCTSSLALVRLEVVDLPHPWP